MIYATPSQDLPLDDFHTLSLVCQAEQCKQVYTTSPISCTHIYIYNYLYNYMYIVYVYMGTPLIFTLRIYFVWLSMYASFTYTCGKKEAFSHWTFRSRLARGEIIIETFKADVRGECTKHSHVCGSHCML